MSQAALAEDFNAQPVPDFLPWHVQQACAGQSVHFKVHKGLRESMQVPENISVSQWAEKHRRVTAVDAFPGKWRNDLIPHAAFIMDLISRPEVREVALCMVERAGKTNIFLNAAMWQLDRGVDSGNIFWLMPSESEAKKALGERIIPALKASDRTARLLSRYADDTTRTMVRFSHGPRLFPAWAQSAASVSSFFGKLCIGDEIDKADTKGVGTETDIITLLEKRMRDDEAAKLLLGSTPAKRFIFKRTMSRQHVYGFFSRCPHCHELVMMDAEHFVFPKDATPEDLKAGVYQVEYSCNACGAMWDEEDRRSAYRHGRFQLIKGHDVERATTIGVHLPAFPLPNIKMGEIAAAIKKAESGDLEAERDLAHGYKAIDHEKQLSTRKEDTILALRDDRIEAELPSAPIAAITAVADMQKRGFWYKITAWGYGLTQESWLLKAGFVDSWEALRKLFYESEFRDAQGTPHIITLRGMDSGGGESDESELSRTAEAYIFAYENPGMLLFKGQKRMSRAFSVTDLDKIPGTNKALPGGLKLYNLNSNHFKDRLAGKLQVAPADPGAWHLHRDTDIDFAKQMCAEGKDDKGYWENPKKKDNHYWDCSYMELALVEIHQVKLWQRPEAVVESQPQRRVISKGVRRD
ncbi:phage terminase large subunit family protein [Desulfuromonas sp. KJ2020]|uniref:terminase gpA endonuclease subunit n=1 Tax=Desulfuromonas sp. KJ2020 TaxID=2919173 RepID=UPI0020A7D210|nr:terminase gpA endonuclease subunit [Desulfuromonas sp. KJ2020]MCP3177292.1 phage terminase large subunit family protein [Desulfuromonas sp. KJ2020]